MTQVSSIFPQLLVRTTADPKAKKKRPKRGFDVNGDRSKTAHRKYDHAQMLQDRLSGMTWLQVAEKHEVSPGAKNGDRASNAYTLALNSAASHRLKPHEVARLTEAPELHPKATKPK